MRFEGSFGSWLKQRRKALDLTQQDLADQVSYSVVTIRKIERDVSRPSKQIVERLADVLAVAPDERPAFLNFARRVTDLLSGVPNDEMLFAPAHNLPFQSTAFLGRENELAQIAARLNDPTCRLLTLVGPGGIGKTRLALQAASDLAGEFADGVYFVSLAPVHSADLLVSAIGSALKFSFYGQEAPTIQLLNYLRQKKLLLVLDNFEHLLEGTPLLVDILVNTPQVKLLVTSRERLKLNSEWVLPVTGMDYPEAADQDQMENYAAVQLFVQSAGRVQAGFSLNTDEASVLHICQLVEGMPLGILLAAAWVGVLSIQEIAREIQKSLNFLESDQRDIPARQRSLRVVFDHSWQLLVEEEREAFRKLSVFRGSFTREAAQQIASTSLKTLVALVNKSLLRRDASTGRYEIHELLRQYGEEQLNASPEESEHIHDLHCSYYADFIEKQLKGLMSSRQVAVLDEIGVEYNNVLKCWSNAVEKCKVRIFRDMALSLWYFCDLRTTHPEAEDLFRRAAEMVQVLPAGEENEIVLGLMLALQAWFTEGPTPVALQAKALVEKGLVILRRRDCPQEMVFALVCLANISFLSLRQFTKAEQAAREGLRIAQENRTLWGLGPCLLQLGGSILAQGDFVQARQFGEACLKAGEASGDVYVMAAAAQLLGCVARDQGDYAEAERQSEQALQWFKELESGQPWHTAVACSDLGKVALLTQDYRKAKYWLQQSMSYQQKTGRREPIYYEALHDVSELFTAQGRKEDAVELLSLLQSQTPHQYISDLVATSLAELQTTLATEIYRAAVAGGKSLDFDRVVAKFLAE